MIKQYNVGVISLGCSKNRVDTEEMLGYLTASGRFLVVNDARDADVIIVNTCGFIVSAKEESIETILEMAGYKQGERHVTLVVTGCLSERYKGELPSELPEVDLWFGIREYSTLPNKLLEHLGETPCSPSHCAPARVLTTPNYSAYLRIADGCNNRCTYCAIPLIRGPLKSFDQSDLICEAKRLIDTGVTEITLIAQDTSGYGVDTMGETKLLPLMHKIADMDGLRFLRVLYTYPDTVTKELIAGMNEHDKICNYLDIPLQHINDTMLKSMNRRGTSAHIKDVLTYIRTNAPDFILRTTMMVGFPGETDEMFEEMLTFLRDYPFDRVGAFTFSPEENTPAALMTDQIDEFVKEERLQRLMLQQKSIANSRAVSRIGTEADVLITGKNGKYLTGRSYAEAPEVDGMILLKGEDVAAGSYVRARLTAVTGYDMLGEIIK